MNKPLALVCLLLALALSALLAVRALEKDPEVMPAEVSDQAAPFEAAAPAELEPEPDIAVADVSEPASVPDSGVRREILGAGQGEHAIEGRVIDETGAGVAVFSLEVEHKPKGIGSDWEPREWGPFENGEFRVEGLVAGRWRMKATGPEHTTSKRKSLRTPYTKDPLVFELQRKATLGGIVLDPNGEPRAGAKVAVKCEGIEGDYETDAEGRFEAKVLVGQYHCFASDGTFGASEIAHGSTEFGRSTEIELRLRRGGRIEGEALDPEGLPLKGYFINLRTFEWHLDQHIVVADDLGKFVIPHVAPGTYWLEAVKKKGQRANGGQPTRKAAEVVDGETTRIVLGGINPHAVMVRGTVYLAEVPQPKERVWAVMEGSESFGSGAMVTANEMGEYAIEFPASGRGQILVSHGGTGIVPLPIVLTTEKEQIFDIHIPTGRISGRVLGVSTGEVSPPSVTCNPEGLGPVTSIYLARSVKADAQGEFVFEGLPPGSYRVAITGALDPRAVLESIELPVDGDVQGLQLVGGGKGRVEVVVLDQAGLPASGAKVYAQDSAGHLYMPGMTGATGVDGTHSYTRLGQGEFRFFAQVDAADTVTPLSEPVTVDPEATTRIEVQLAPGARATIRVLDGEEPSSARLWIWDRDGNEFSRTLAAFDSARYIVDGENLGSYLLGPLAAGTYQVRARAFDGSSAEGELVLQAGKPANLTLQLKP